MVGMMIPRFAGSLAAGAIITSAQAASRLHSEFAVPRVVFSDADCLNATSKKPLSQGRKLMLRRYAFAAVAGLAVITPIDARGR